MSSLAARSAEDVDSYCESHYRGCLLGKEPLRSVYNCPGNHIQNMHMYTWACIIPALCTVDWCPICLVSSSELTPLWELPQVCEYSLIRNSIMWYLICQGVQFRDAHPGLCHFWIPLFWLSRLLVISYGLSAIDILPMLIHVYVSMYLMHCINNTFIYPQEATISNYFSLDIWQLSFYLCMHAICTVAQGPNNNIWHCEKKTISNGNIPG
jgi:hypothetical protein